MRSARAFAHQETAFIGENVCTVRRVRVAGIPATWIFSEFDTDAPLDGVAVARPAQLGDAGPAVLQRMELLGAPPAPVGISPPPDGDEHWQGVFHEEVRLVKVVTTLLRCHHWQGSGGGRMTYDLDLSLDGETRRRPRIPARDRPRVDPPGAGPQDRRVHRGHLGPAGAAGVPVLDRLDPRLGARWHQQRAEVTPYTPRGGRGRLRAAVDAWVQFLGNSAGPYVDLLDDVSSRARARTYSTPDLLADGRRLWSQLAKDWARAWTSWTTRSRRSPRRGSTPG